MLHAYAPMTDMPNNSHHQREVRPRWRVAFGAICLGVVAIVGMVQDLALSRDEIKMSFSYDIVVESPPASLKTRRNGDDIFFKILQIPDMHYTGRPDYPCRGPPSLPCMESNMTNFIAHLLDTEKPDFVVFSGDQIEAVEVKQTADEVRKAIEAYSKEAIKRRIPWSMVFGNHDEGSTASREQMFEQISYLPYSFSQPGLPGIGGLGNYVLEVHNASSKATVLRLYFLDTGRSGNIAAGQKEFLLNISSSRPERDVPALLFYHIPTPDYIIQPGDHIEHGHQGEEVSHGPECGLMQTLVDMGDVKATFVGHDHFNDYCVKRKEIQLCYGGGVGFGAAYGSVSILRRARLIEYSRNATTETISTWIHSVKGTVSKDKYMLYQHQHSN
ncbi:hypothetical protein THRCLA_00543 [Thraustotheca clavata]|uniref:Calcineurin-like phosphoesterase domain-containing protein n=1 Tax=Thraustotheca clavata TaxID=74557 RepID=A0A1W0AB84_9STRA|nr:hypothetical protein THRCLA_00543 [Thraustotheca clavata]